jgi:hypothetical protein
MCLSSFIGPAVRLVTLAELSCLPYLTFQDSSRAMALLAPTPPHCGVGPPRNALNTTIVTATLLALSV